MREEIEAVIRELETDSNYHGSQYTNKWADLREYHLGFEAGLDKAIDKLKEVLSQHEASDTGNASVNE